MSQTQQDPKRPKTHLLRRVLSRIVGALLLLLLAALLALQSADVQSYIVRKAIERIAGEIDGEIRFESAQLRPLHGLVIKGLVITDSYPYESSYPDLPPAPDTLLRVGTLSATFSLRTLLTEGSLPVRSLSLRDADVYLTLEPGNDNFSRVFRISDESDTTALSLPEIRIRKVDLTDVRFRMIDYEEMEKQLARDSLWRPADETDWANFIAYLERMQAGSLTIAENLESIETDILRLKVQETRSGFAFEDITGHLRVDGAGAVLTGGRILDPWTDLSVKRLAMLYTGFGDFKRTLAKIRFELELGRSHFDLESVRILSEELKDLHFSCDFEGAAEGPINDMRFHDFHLFGTDSGVTARHISGRLRHVPKVPKMILDFNVEGFEGTASAISELVRGWKPEMDLSMLRDYFGDRLIRANATSSGTLDALNIEGTAFYGSGTASIAAVFRHLYSAEPIVVEGDLTTQDFPLGNVLGIESLGGLSLKGTAQATLLPGGKLDATLSRLHIDRLQALGYDYSDIDATGQLHSDGFKGNIVSRDPNLDFIFSGSLAYPAEGRSGHYAFRAEVGYANLAALHLDPRPVSELDFRLKADYEVTPSGGIRGEAAMREIHLRSESGDHDVGDILVYSASTEEDYTIDLLSAFASAHYTGTRPLLDFAEELSAECVARDLPALLNLPEEADPLPPTMGEYNFRLRVGDTRELLGFLAPGLYVAEGTQLALRLDPDSGTRAALRSEGLLYNGIFAKDLGLRFAASEDRHLRAELTAREVGLGSGPTMQEARLSAYGESDAVQWRYRFDLSEPALSGDGGELNLRTFLSRDPENGALLLTADIPASTLRYMGSPWDISAREISYRADDLGIGQLVLSSGDQYIRADGRIAPYDDALMNLTIQDFDIDLLNRLSPDLGLGLEGRLSGRVEMLSPFERMPIIDARLLCEDTKVGGWDIGALRLMSQWIDDEERFSLRLRDDGRTLDLGGFFVPGGDYRLDTQLHLNGFQIGCAAPLLTSVFSDFEGLAYGDVLISGPLAKLNVQGKDLRVQDGLLQLDYTDVPYLVEGPLELTEEHLLFDKLSVRDRYTGKAAIRGGIFFADNFNRLSYDLAIEMEEMECLDLGKKQNDVFYGNVFGSGKVDVRGDLDAFRLNVNARTVRKGALHIPFDYLSDAASGDLLRFVEPAPERINPLDSILNRQRRSAEVPMAIDLDIHVEATPEVQMLIEVDPSTGNVLTAYGEGALDLGYHKDEFTIGGDYTLSGGNYHLSALVTTRDFSIRSGSQVHFNGDIYDSDLDITAVYSTKASLSSLIADSTMTRRKVDCYINVKDKLRNPSVDISIDIPDLDPTTQGLVSAALNSQDNIQRQFLALLVSGSFLPSEQSGIVNNNSDLLFSNVSAIMSDQLNGILASLNIPFDLGLNYQNTAAGNDLFDVAISTQLFNNRVLINGNIGNRQYGTTVTGATMGTVAGDLDIAIKLNKTGSIRATLFSHSADQYTNYLDYSQRNGAGFSFQKEFSTVGALLRSIFLGPGWNSDAEKQSDSALHTLVIPKEASDEP